MDTKQNLPETVSENALSNGNKPKQPGDLGLRANRTVNEFLVAEMFLVQAAIESASALGEGIEEARNAWRAGDDVGAVLKRTRQGVFEPYRERYNYFRRLMDQD